MQQHSFYTTCGTCPLLNSVRFRNHFTCWPHCLSASLISAGSCFFSGRDPILPVFLLRRQYMYVLLNAASFYQSCKPALSADALSLHPDSMSMCGLVSAVTDLDKVFENPAGFRARRGF